MSRIIKNIRNLLFLVGVILPANVYAAEITAIDFNGDIIGQVISTGMVISPDGDNIGSVTADSLIINENGVVVGGVVPQGVVIGMDNKLLGKIHGDGVVRSLSGKTLGRALPNGLVIDDASEIIGAVLYPGIVYSPNGEAIGRLTGGGEYTKLEGQHVGFVSANGYAYRKSGEDYILDGKLMSSKMVVSVDGKFLGSIAPTGQIVNFEGKAIGRIHANGFAYDAQGKIIGSIIATGYAYNQSGNYIGVVGYNGEVKDGEKVVARYRADGNLVRDNGEVIGFAVDVAATANDNRGKYLGYVIPDGSIVRGGKVVGHIGGKGFVYDDNGNKIGSLIKTGPVFDGLARLKGQSMSNGRLIALNGGNIGHMSGNYAYDANGTLLGGTIEGMLALENSTVIGISEIDAEIMSGGNSVRVSPFGYVIGTDGKTLGRGYEMSAVYGPDGILYSYIDPNGTMYRPTTDVHLSETGIAYDNKNYVGEILNPRYALSYDGVSLGKFANSNLILNNSGRVNYKIIPGGYVVDVRDQSSPATSPVSGFSGNKLIALNTGGDLIGYTNSEGQIIGTDGEIAGQVTYNEYVVDNNKVVNGKLVPFAEIVNDKCSIIGVVNGKGDVIDNRDVISGHILPNGQAVSDVGNYIGYAVSNSALIDFNGAFSGTVNGATGKDLNGKVIGCVNRQGIIVDEEHRQRYGVITPEPVIDFDDKILGRVLANGKVVDGKDSAIGYMQPNGNVVSTTKRVLGNVMRYKVAFKDTNEFLGMIDGSGQVKNARGEIVGKVNFDGSVESDGMHVGYALYDFYVYDENFITYGYLTKDGTVLSMVGSRLGKMDRGFVIDRHGEVVARGNRDYLVRDNNHNVVGELLLGGTVVSPEGVNVGYLRDGGAIINSDDNEIAKATPYQYYVVIPSDHEISQPGKLHVEPVEAQVGQKPQQKPTKPTTRHEQYRRKNLGIAIDPNGDIIGDVYDDNTVRLDGELKGYVLPDGTVVDENYNPIGTVEEKVPPKQQMFMPPDAYDNEEKPNVGADGGVGPGGRYDPRRMAALQGMQSLRREKIDVGHVHSGYNPSVFTGYEEDGWPGQNRSISSWRVDMSEMILEDKGIPAVLARSVYASEGLGDNIPITAIVERNVYAEEGRNVIIPAGSRVIGTFGSDMGDVGGQSGGAVKINITWRRLIRPDGSQWTFGNAQTADAQGRAGAIGYLDEQLMKRYTFPLVSTALQGLINMALADGGSSTTTTNSNGTTTTEDARSAAARETRQQINDKINDIVNQIMERKSRIKSVAYVPAGTRIIIYPNQDLWLNSFERDKKRSTEGGDSDPGKAVKLVSDGNGGGGGSAEVTYDGGSAGNVQPVSASSNQPKGPSGGGLVSSPSNRQNTTPTQPSQPAQPAPAIESTNDDDLLGVGDDDGLL